MSLDFIQLGMLGVSIAMVLVLVVTLVYVVRWKLAFTVRGEEDAFQLVPDGVVHKNLGALRKLKKQLATHEKHQIAVAQSIVDAQQGIAKSLIASNESLKERQDKSFEALQAVLGAVKGLREETQILRNEIQVQAMELERHRAGYDVDILSTSLIPVARMHRMLVTDLANPDLSEEARNTLLALEDDHLGILETNGVKLTHPPVGEKYRDQKNIQHPPATEPAPSEELAGSIKEVSYPAYELETSARTVVLLEAEVVVYVSVPSGRSSDIEDKEKEET